MFDIRLEPEFSSWFETLSAYDAEEVAAALDLVARLGISDPPQVSRALLWFDSTDGAPVWDDTLEFVVSKAAEELRSVVAWQRELLGALDSPPFRDRVARLSTAASVEVLAKVAHLRTEIRAWQQEVLLQAGSGRPSVGTYAARRAEVTRAFASVFELLGLSPERFTTLVNGLRELTVASTNPKFRILLGLDVEARRLVALLGEPLSRRYYGDSVRRAEARWASYTRRVIAHRKEGAP